MQKSKEGYVVFLTEVHPEARIEDIQMALLQAGGMGRVNCPLDKKTSYVKGYAFIEFKEQKTAERVIKACNDGDVTINDQPVKASHAFCSEPDSFTRQKRLNNKGRRPNHQ